jgi:hypothetical protein
VTTKEKIQFAIDKVPTLTDFGIGLFEEDRNLPIAEQKKRFKEEQVLLLKNLEEFERLCEWLKSIDKIKTINKNHTSYGLKHLAEKTVGYSTNGTFIAAAIYSGFDIKINKDSPNPQFNMSEKSLKLQDPYYKNDIFEI